MAIITLDGCGILSGTYDTEEMDRKREEERKQEEAEAEREAKLQLTCDVIDYALTPAVRPQLEEENAIARISDENKADFAAFKKCCERWGLPHLPAPPQAVAVFLSENCDEGAEYVARLRDSIATVHTALNFPNPCDDILVRAIVRLVKTAKPTKKERN